MDTLQNIWTELGERLRRFIGTRIGDAATADDITQDVMLKVQSQLDALPPEDKLPAWIFRIARNAVIDHYRARSIREHANVDDVQPSDTAALAAERQDALHDLTPCLTRMVEQLPEPYREAMQLADFEGVPQQEIADRIGVSLSGAKSRVQRARQQLRKMIEDCCKIKRDGRGNVFDYERTERSSRYPDSL